jgi:hypothetical protein
VHETAARDRRRAAGNLLAIVIFLIAAGSRAPAAVCSIRSSAATARSPGSTRTRPSRRGASSASSCGCLRWRYAYPYLPGAQTEAFRGLSVLVGLMVVAWRNERHRPGLQRLHPDVQPRVSKRRLRANRRQ